jgi:hypothetical protein
MAFRRITLLVQLDQTNHYYNSHFYRLSNLILHGLNFVFSMENSV